MKWVFAYVVLGLFTAGFVAADQEARGEAMTGDLTIAATVIWPVVWGVAAFNATRNE
jgi:hypothetical protein